jgi:hypothetical protein
LRPARLLLLASVSVLGILFPCALSAQGWDAARSATGWASFDRDGSCVFHDSASRKLRIWTRDGGEMGDVDLARLSAAPERWVLDPSGNAWVVSGTTLQFVAKNGKLGPSHSLPAEVADLAWDTTGFVLVYRTPAPLVERRDMKGGGLLWTWGTRPPKGTFYPSIRHHVAIREDGTVLVASGETLGLTVLDGAKGTPIATLAFNLDGKPAPALNLGTGNRGPMAWWLDRNTALLAVPASQLPPGGTAQGLLLAKLDLASHNLSLFPTGCDEKATFVGIQEENAVLEKPEGGLVFVPIP